MATWGYYGTLTEHNNYWTSHGDPATWTDATDAQKTAALVTASEYLDARYGRLWKGIRATETQVLDWPRSGVYDLSWYSVDDDTVPQAIKDCISILAVKVLGGTDLFPDIAAGSVGSYRLAGESKSIGPLSKSTQYAEGSGSVSHLPRFTKVEHLLRSSGLLQAPGSARRG